MAEPEWELTKENFQPLRRGRKVVADAPPPVDAQRVALDRKRRCSPRLFVFVFDLAGFTHLQTSSAAPDVFLSSYSSAVKLQKRIPPEKPLAMLVLCT